MIHENVNRCLSEDERELYLLDRLNGTALDRVEDHLLFCRDCQDALQKERDFILSLRKALRLGALTQQRSPIRWMAPVGLAAAVIIGLSLMLVPGGVAPTSDAIAQVELVVTRSVAAAQLAKAPARQPFVVTLNLEQLPARPSFDLEIVDSGGRSVFLGRGESKGGWLSMQADALAPGTYWVRLSSGGLLLREYGLRVQ